MLNGFLYTNAQFSLSLSVTFPIFGSSHPLNFPKNPGKMPIITKAHPISNLIYGLIRFL